MDPFVKSAFLWGLVGALAFLALHQGWVLYRGEFTSVGVMLGVALAVGTVTTAFAYAGERRLAERKS